MKHTKGKWIKSGIGDFVWILDENENYIAEVVCSDEEGHYIENEEEREANAHLIAAAPDLLEACRAANNKLCELNQDAGDTLFIAEELAILEEAIIKARGN